MFALGITLKTMKGRGLRLIHLSFAKPERFYACDVFTLTRYTHKIYSIDRVEHKLTCIQAQPANGDS